MKIHRFIGAFDFRKNTINIEDIEIIKQVRNVLRMEPGETIILFDGKGMEAEVVIESINSQAIVCNIVSKKKLEEIGKSVSLYLAILKKENFELSVQKAVECGVSKIIPVITERTVKTGLNMERINKIIREAAEQCGRGLLPEILPTMSFPDALVDGGGSDEKTIFHLVKEEYAPNRNAKSASIFIGPEGGFTDKEIELAKNSGYSVVSLGALTLRGETAAIVATYRAAQGI